MGAPIVSGMQNIRVFVFDPGHNLGGNCELYCYKA